MMDLAAAVPHPIIPVVSELKKMMTEDMQKSSENDASEKTLVMAAGEMIADGTETHTAGEAAADGTTEMETGVMEEIGRMVIGLERRIDQSGAPIQDRQPVQRLLLVLEDLQRPL